MPNVVDSIVNRGSSTLTREQRLQVFDMMASQSAYQIGLSFGLDKYYKNSKTISAAIYRIYREVANNAKEYGISDDKLALVDAAIKSRSLSQRRGIIKTEQADRLEAIKGKNMEELVKENRNKAWVLLGLKLDDALSTRRKREKIAIGEIAKVAGIVFDKGQITDGKATDHVALMGKVDRELSPAETLDLVSKMREYNNAISDEFSKTK